MLDLRGLDASPVLAPYCSTNRRGGDPELAGQLTLRDPACVPLAHVPNGLRGEDGAGVSAPVRDTILLGHVPHVGCPITQPEMAHAQRIVPCGAVVADMPAARDRAVFQFPRYAVCQQAARPPIHNDIEHPVAPVVRGSRPEPTVAALIHLGPEADGQVLPSRGAAAPTRAMALLLVRTTPEGRAAAHALLLNLPMGSGHWCGDKYTRKHNHHAH
jgi:hypothetical protein